MPIYAAALAALVLAVPAAATTNASSDSGVTATATETPTEEPTTPAYVPNTPLTNVYIQCGGETKEGTVNALTGSYYPTWSEDKPTGSITGGEGCGQVDEGVFGGIRPQTPFEFSAVGYYTGNLDKLTFKMHNIYASRNRQSGGPSTVNVRVLVDGESLFGLASTTNAAGDVSTEPAPKKMTIKPVGTGATGAAALYDGTITGINLLLPTDNIEHEVVFNITTTEPMNVWAWGNTEAQSCLTFNPETATGVTAVAVPRDKRS